jgi:hypothetical protein
VAAQPASSGLPCRPFERRWRNFCVDKNLKDDWLERLNSLRSFDLISICEGHPDEPSYPHRRLPHINLRLKDGLAELLLPSWISEKFNFGSVLARSFTNGHTSAQFELRSGFTARQQKSEFEELGLLKLSPRVDILNFDRDQFEVRWFEQNICSVEEFDGFVSRFASGIKARGDTL